MTRDVRVEFEDSMHVNKENPKYKKLLTNPADGSADQQVQQQGKRRSNFGNHQQHKKAKHFDSGKKQQDHHQHGHQNTHHEQKRGRGPGSQQYSELGEETDKVDDEEKLDDLD